MVVVVILVYILIGSIEIAPLVVQKKKKEMVLYAVLFAAAFAISILLSLKVKIPSPAKLIQGLFEAILGKQE